ncbi:hypothetical protein GDO81_006600 [Engystomops pustulosus]|uniref:Uncharacterized protein n=1 Tax=Engystomops pustulosus TaxID=76066 RepID=A0AAV7CXZ6_ENGPU|nr:hypothetical protein GDO81_006600 [Engystomops pustulosus]
MRFGIVGFIPPITFSFSNIFFSRPQGKELKMIGDHFIVNKASPPPNSRTRKPQLFPRNLPDSDSMQEKMHYMAPIWITAPTAVGTHKFHCVKSFILVLKFEKIGSCIFLDERYTRMIVDHHTYVTKHIVDLQSPCFNI